MASPRWEPLFSGQAAEAYEQVIDAIVEAVDHSGVRDTDWGRPLIHAYLAQARSSEAHRAQAAELVDRAIDVLGSTVSRPSLFGGIAGVGWLSAHTDAFCDRRDDDAYEEIDNALLQ